VEQAAARGAGQPSMQKSEYGPVSQQGETPGQEEAQDTTPGGLIVVLCGHKFLSSLLIFIPFAFVSYHYALPDWVVFTCNFFAILPMAWLIGKSTEDLASYTGEAASALLNATFGNVVELLLCIAGIRLDQLAVVQCTLVGSILSNLLLVMGTSFIWGGYRNPPIQKYSKIGAGAQSSMMLLAVLGVVLPTMYNVLVPGEQAILRISRGCSFLLLGVYVQYLFFTLGTHKDAFQSEDGGDDEEAPDMDGKTSLVVLALCTILTAFCSEYLIDSIEGTIERWKVSKEFIGIVVLPIIGNAAEHYTAIIVAGQNKMDLSLGVAAGSSCQMALFVTPITVIVGWIFDKPMSLDFHPFQVTVLLLAVLIVANVLKDGQSNWLEGSMLCTAYGAISLIYFCEDSSGSNIQFE